MGEQIDRHSAAKHFARSHAPMASSQSSQLGQRVHLGYQSRNTGQVLAGHDPSRAEMTCRKMAIRLARATTQSRSYLNEAPPESRPQLPGSI